MGLIVNIFFSGTKISLEKSVVLKSEMVDLTQLRSFEQVKAASSNPEMILQLENLLLQWHNQLEQVCIVLSILTF